MKKILIIFAVFIGLTIHAQQDAQYTQYMYNMSAINPAYAGSGGSTSFGILQRSQWHGLDGAPKTTTVFGHTPVSEKVGLGASIISDKIGVYSKTNITTDFSYLVKLSDKHHLSFGLKAGGSIHNIGLASIDLKEENDPLFSQNINTVRPIFGTGVLFYTDKFYIAASIPNVLESLHTDANNNELGLGYRHYFFTGGYLFNLSENLKFKPSFLIKSAFEATPSYDINANIEINKKVEFGLSYRLEDSFSGLINLSVTPNIKIGYAYDAVISNLRNYAASSHEFLVLIDINTKVASRPARFF